MSSSLSLGQCATLACLLEVITPKAGNVHRGARFRRSDTQGLRGKRRGDWSGHRVGGESWGGARRSRGDPRDPTIRRHQHEPRYGPADRPPCSRSTRVDARGRNRPSADVANIPRQQPGLSGDSPREPGGMGQVDQMDVQQSAPTNLLEAMQAAADRDMVARQYVDGFQTVLNEVVPSLVENVSHGFSIEYAIIHTQMQLLSRYPDSLITRKCGKHVAQQAAAMANAVIQAGSPGSPDYERAMADLDFWMRSDHHRRNPGTTADLIAAGLFAALREGQLALPFRTRRKRSEAFPSQNSLEFGCQRWMAGLWRVQ